MTSKSTTDTPRQVAESVKIYFRRLGSIKDAAERMGVSPQTVHSQLRGDKYLSHKIAYRFARSFGFSVDYLTSGQGLLFGAAEDEDIILPESFTLTFDNKEGAPDSLHRPAELKPGQNAVIWTAFDAVRLRLNDKRREYLVLLATLQELDGMLNPSSEEAQWSARIIAQTKKVDIPIL